MEEDIKPEEKDEISPILNVKIAVIKKHATTRLQKIGVDNLC